MFKKFTSTSSVSTHLFPPWFIFFALLSASYQQKHDTFEMGDRSKSESCMHSKTPTDPPVLYLKNLKISCQMHECIDYTWNMKLHVSACITTLHRLDKEKEKKFLMELNPVIVFPYNLFHFHIHTFVLNGSCQEIKLFSLSKNNSFNFSFTGFNVWKSKRQIHKGDNPQDHSFLYSCDFVVFSIISLNGHINFLLHRFNYQQDCLEMWETTRKKKELSRTLRAGKLPCPYANKGKATETFTKRESLHFLFVVTTSFPGFFCALWRFPKTECILECVRILTQPPHKRSTFWCLLQWKWAFKLCIDASLI